MSENGFKIKYILTKTDGKPVDKWGKYFVLKLNSKDEEHARASRSAVKLYARMIRKSNPELADDLDNLVARVMLGKMRFGDEYERG
jgi:hypothetical protein